MTVHIVRTGPRSLLVAAPSSAWVAYGVPPSGPFDRAAYEAGLALVGGRPGAAAFEVVLGGLCLRTEAAVRVAVTGAAVPITVDGAPIDGPVVTLHAGSELALGMARTGLRTYVAVGGGLVTSRRGLIGGYGPRPVLAGDAVAVRDAQAPREPPRSREAEDDVLQVLPGPRLSHLADPAALAGVWTISPHSDRVGVRLDGAPLARTGTAEVPPEGIVRGGLQAPPSGPLVIFGPDHPITGGYPVVGVLTPDSTDALAQRRPGDRVILRWV